jgi:hypothetical protein
MRTSRNGLPLYEVGADKPASSGVGGPQLSGGSFGGSGGAQVEMNFPAGGGGGITLTPGQGVQSLGAGAAGQAKAADALKTPGPQSGAGTGASPNPAQSGGGLQLSPGAGVQSLGAGAAGQRAALDAIKGLTQSTTGLPVASPSEPVTLDKLDKIRELGQMVEDGSIRRVRSIIRKGGALGRLARELLR